MADPNGSKRAKTSLVLGILSLVCTVLTGIPAIVLGVRALKQLRAHPEQRGARGLALAGVATGTLGSLALIPATLFALHWLEVRDREASANKLWQMGVALSGYRNVIGGNEYAPGYGPGGRPLLSWRVYLLPWLEESALYGEFHLDEPWDSPHNQALLPRMPKVYAAVRNPPAEPYSTYYRMFPGNATMFTLLDRTQVGREHTRFIFVEAGEAVPWTKPEELPYAAGQPLPRLGAMFHGDFQAYCSDGDVHFFPRGTDEKTLRAYVSGDPSGRLPVEPGRPE